MQAWKILAPCAIALAALAATAVAQTAVVVRDAELAVPFGATKGQLAIAGTHLVFISTGSPEMSVGIDRADIRSVDRSGDTVTVVTRNALRDRSGARDTFRFRMSDAAEVVSWYERTPAMASSGAPPPPAGASNVLATYQVKHDHRIGSCQGRLIVMADRLGFESIDEIDDSRQWMLADIKEVEQSGIYRLKVEPFIGDTFNFELAGKGIDSGEYRRLVDRIAKARSSR